MKKSKFLFPTTLLIGFLFLTFFSCQKENHTESIIEESALSISPDDLHQVDKNLKSSSNRLKTEDCCSPITAEQLDVNCVEGDLEICFPILDCEEGQFNSINFNMFPIIGGVIQSTGTPITNSGDNPISLEGNCFTITEADGFDSNLEYAIYPYHHADCDGDGEVELIPDDYVTTDPVIFEECGPECEFSLNLDAQFQISMGISETGICGLILDLDELYDFCDENYQECCPKGIENINLTLPVYINGIKQTSNPFGFGIYGARCESKDHTIGPIYRSCNLNAGDTLQLKAEILEINSECNIITPPNNIFFSNEYIVTAEDIELCCG